MIWILAICVWVLVMLCVVLASRVRRLQSDLDWWRSEVVRLNGELPKRDSKGRYCKK
jgi:hypothetical protein